MTPSHITRRRALTAGALSLGSLLKSQPSIKEPRFDALRRGLTGSLILPGDAAYDSARRLASPNPENDHHPRAIVRCAHAGDAARALAFAREYELEVAVRSGGHDVLGASMGNGVTIDLSAMKAVRLDAERRVVQVEAGVRSGELNARTQPSGLVAVLGCHPGVGVAGLTLGGGLGWFLGRHGAACDHLLGAEIILANGNAVRASEKENPELFWALRGGGGNFGIVTSLEYRLHPVDRVFGGVMVLRADAGQFLRFLGPFLAASPIDLTVETTMLRGVPPAIVALVCYGGDPVEGERAVAPLRSFSSPLADWLGVVPYVALTNRMADVGPVLGAPPPPARSTGPMYNFWRGTSLSDLNGAADRIAEILETAPRGCSLGFGHYMHGQVCRIAPAETPLLRTPGQLTLFANASWGDPRAADACMDWVRNAQAVLRPFAGPATYINYLSSNDPKLVKASYGANYARVVRAKRQFDPDNVFRGNRNVNPSG